jgi:hypothetical protein
MVQYGVLTIVIAGLGTTAQAQHACNPVTDGTYCATQMPRSRTQPSLSPPPYRSMTSELGLTQERPAAFGAVIFRGGGSRCVGGLFRGGCS